MDAKDKFLPVEYKVLVLPDPVEEYRGKIIIPENVRDREQIAQDRATIIAVGGNAFEEWLGSVPQVGDRVLLNKHAGYVMKDKEESKEYRVVNDKDITLILKEIENE
ncbi:MAG: hypothetical protein KGY70_14500 [Bacteroidales bacterium]|nr:hypothetical protein [Bacteroidales bacterium]